MWRRMGCSSSSAESTRSGGIDHEEVVRRFRDVQSGASDALANAGKNVISSELDKLCVERLWSIVYDAEDAEQDLKLLRQQEELETNSQSRKRLHQKMSSICEEYQDLGKKFKSFVSSRRDGTRREEPERSSPGCFPSQKNIYSLEEYKDVIVKILTGKGQQKLKDLLLQKDCKASNSSKLIIFPIAGVAGSGKTTLVQHIFQDAEIRKLFTGLWVGAFGTRDVLGLTNLVLEYAGGSRCRQLSMAQSKLMEWLDQEKKRILLVLDDACNTNRHLWENFWAPFMQSQVEGCVVLITTRDYEVIDALPNHLPRIEHLTIPPLEFEDCWALFVSIVGSSRAEDGEFKEIGEKIISRCEGIPFAIKHAANSLRFKDQLWEWEEFSKVDLCSLATYRELSLPLKRCFLFCALFPRGYSISREYLIKLWISQDFIKEAGRGTRLRDLADKDYFTPLLHKYLICHSWEESYKYEMPNPVRNLADSILRPYFRRLNDPNCLYNGENSSPEKVRHISYVVQDGDVEINIPSLSDFRNLRSFLIVQKENRTVRLRSVADNTFENMRYLRTLDLSYTDITELPSSIGHLRSLCFLGLNGTQIGHLPESLCSLYNLQTLELNLCKKLSGLPKDIGNLVRLQYLLLDPILTSFCFPEGLSRLTDLKALPIFNASKKQNECTRTDELKYSGIQELEKLNNLVELHIRGLYNVSVEDSKLANLDRKTLLQDLTLSWSSWWDKSNQQGGYSSETQIMDINSHLQQVLNNLKPHVNLRNLAIEYYAGREFPKWVGDSSFKKLKYIKLKDCTNCDVLPSLGLLPSLEYLAICCKAVKQIDSTFCRRIPTPPTRTSSVCGGFSSLKELVFGDMNEWENWSAVTEEDFTSLNDLSLLNCPLLTELPMIKHLKSLKMKNCNSITSIPSFPFLEELEVSYSKVLLNCSLLTELPENKHLKSLKMENCNSITSMPSFPSLEKLEISYSKELTAIPSLDSLTSMQMLNCDKVRHFPASSRLEKLEIKDCKELEGFDSLINLKKLTVENCGNVRQLPDFPDLLELEIHNCTGLETFISMMSLKKLHIRGNNKLAVNSIPEGIETLIIGSHGTLLSLDELCQKKLETLEIFSCPKLSSIPQMDSLKSLTIENCDELREIPLLKSLTSLTLMYCGQLETIHKQPELRDLWFEDCDQLRYVKVKDNIVTCLNSLLIANCYDDDLSGITLTLGCDSKSSVKSKFLLSFEPWTREDKG